MLFIGDIPVGFRHVRTADRVVLDFPRARPVPPGDPVCPITLDQVSISLGAVPPALDREGKGMSSLAGRVTGGLLAMSTLSVSMTPGAAAPVSQHGWDHPIDDQ